MSPRGATDDDWLRAVYGEPSEPEQSPEPEPPALRAVADAEPMATGGAGGVGRQDRGGPSQATALVALAEEGYTFGRDTAGAAFALPRGGPPIIRPLRGDADSLRAELAARYYTEYGKAPSATALADALQVLLGRAASTEPVPVHLRVAETDEGLWLDLGDLSGRAVHITAGGWTVVDAAPVLFRRTALTGALLVPVPGGDLGPLWGLVNIPAADRPVVLAVLVATLLPNIAHPVTVMLAEQGAGKSTAARMLAGLLDPSPVPLRKPPKDEDAWVTAASGSHVVAVDNVSRIPEWWSDALCRAATGDGDVRRRLYTDDDLKVFAFRRVVWLTSIDLLGVRDDLADRAVTIHLEALRGSRRLDEEIDRTWTQAHPALLGALLDLAARVLAELPAVSTDDLPRMADFARVLRAVDRVMGTDGSARYQELTANLAIDLATTDPVLGAIAQDITAPWTGSSADLLAKLDDGRWLDRPRPKGWPGTARELTGHLTRSAPTLRQLGWTVDSARGGRNNLLRWTLAPAAGGGLDD